MLMNHAYHPSRDARFPTRWLEEAVAMAMDNRWEEAAALNQRILAAAPEDVGSLNRLGRALMELGQYDGARAAYMKTLEISPSNTIAEKNLARLATLCEETCPGASAGKVDLKMFLADPDKAAITTMKIGRKVAVLAKIAVGEQVHLAVSKRVLQVHDARGVLLGHVEQRLAHRLIELMKGGNRYDAGLISAEDDSARLVIRETYQDASQLGKVSFPPLEVGTPAGALGDGLLNDDEEESEAEDAADEMEETATSAEEATEPEMTSEDRFLA